MALNAGMNAITLDTPGSLENDQFVTEEYFNSRLERLELHMTIKTALIVAGVLTFFKIIEPFLGG